MATQKFNEPSNFFSLITTVQDIPVVVFRKREFDQYVVLQVRVELAPEHKSQLEHLSKDEISHLTMKLISEVAKTKSGAIIQQPPPLSSVTLIARIPITNNLTEASFLDKLDEIVYSATLARTTIALELEESRKRTQITTPSNPK